MLRLVLVVATTVLLTSIQSKDSDEYITCLEKCGTNTADIQVDLCQGSCDWDDKERCLARNAKDLEERRNCVLTGRSRCIGRCIDEPWCEGTFDASEELKLLLNNFFGVTFVFVETGGLGK
ncbi:hypothetical protein CRM22_001463 [Opisthorchis felineus]|uniref:Uncharacterized protein n=1 Tax=Opisthorchis felineus TaxID=147828 RepID=A0A4S2MAN9_OPIFE|nr:hypothetical protein CRM22_001463 [Opisthorchis felineus]